MTQRAAFAKTVVELMERDEKIILCLGDIGVYAFRHAAERWPSRVINMGVTEQASVGFCTGLAMAGYFPVYHTIDAFMVRRTYEQIYLDLGAQKLPALLVSVGFNSDYKNLGPTHESPDSRKIMGTVPGLHIYEPHNPSTAENFIKLAVELRQLAYIRLSERNDA